jgi:hypothetical protein
VPQKQPKNSEEQRQILLFFRSPNHLRPRISAEDDTSIADKSLRKNKNSETRRAVASGCAGRATVSNG